MLSVDPSGELCLAVRVQPGRGSDRVLGSRAGALLLAIGQPAVDGRANQALCRFLAARLGLRQQQVRVLRGAHHRSKVVALQAVGVDAVARWLQAEGIMPQGGTP